MQRLLCFILLFAIACAARAQAAFKLGDLRLGWKDFGVKTLNSGGLQHADLQIRIRYNMAPGRDDSHFIFNSEVYIDASRSRIDQAFLDGATIAERAALLDHEKGHIAIAHIYHKKLQQRIKQHRFTQSLNAETGSILAEIAGELEARNKAYDSATAYGTRKAAQHTWEHDLLQELNAQYPEGMLRISVALALEKPESVWFDELPDYDYKALRSAFEDQFNDNGNGWTDDVDSEPHPAVPVSNGFLEIGTGNATNRSFSTKSDIDFSRNFEIRFAFMIRRSPGKHKGSGGFYWGSSDSASRESFAWVSFDRTHIQIINCHGGDHKHDRRKEAYLYPALKEGQLYQVTVRKVKDRYSVFLNDRLKAELPFEPLPGPYLSFGASVSTPKCRQLFSGVFRFFEPINPGA